MKKSLILSLVAVACGFLSLAVGWIYIQTQLKMTPVLVAKANLEARHLISEEDFEWIQVPKEYVSLDIDVNEEDILNQYVVIDGFIPKGSFFFKSMTETLDESIDMPSLLLRDDQAIYALDASLISTSGNTLVVGQKIDVYGTIKVNKEIIVDPLLTQVRVVGLKDKNGNDVVENANTLPKVLLLAIDRLAIPLMAKLDALGSITLTPTSYQLNEEESLVITDTALWNVLYVQ